MTFYDLVGMEKTTKYDFIWLENFGQLGNNLYLKQKMLGSALVVSTCYDTTEYFGTRETGRCKGDRASAEPPATSQGHHRRSFP
ncbi:hypothetical protein QT972_33085 [Microcoleus sp. herbarium7]